MKKLVACLLALVAGPALAAADVCPKPPAWGQVPDFWSPLAGGNPRGQLAARYDGRWAGAAQVPLDDGSSSARVRFLEGGDGHLYVAFEVDATAYDREVFWLGFTSATATDSNGATLIEISVRPDPNAAQPPPLDEQVVDQAAIRCGAAACPGGSCTQTACGATPLVSYRFLHGVTPTAANTSRFLWDDVAFDATVVAKSWMDPAGGQGARAWHGPLYPPPSSSGQPTGATAMLRIPHGAFGGAAPADVKIWVAAATCQFLGQGPGAGPTVCASQGYWPTAGAIIQDPADANAYEGPAVVDWALLRRTTACPPQPELVAAGVQNDPAGYDPTKSFTWPQRMYLDNDGNLANDPPNWFGARLSFPIQSVAGKYRARFFIADWGSQIGSLDVAQWFEIGQVTNPGTTTAPATEHLVVRWPPATMSAADVKKLACKYSDCDSSVFGCPYPTNAPTDLCAGVAAREHHPHQCTMVRLEAIGATGSYQFARDSQIFNTDFVGASVFWRVASISTAGIENERTPAPLAAPPEGRDLYIYVRPANLPKTSTEIPAEETVERLEAVAGAVTAAMPVPAGIRPPPEVAFAKQLREQLGRRDGQGEMSRERQDGTIKRVRTLPMNTARLVAPALEFFVFYDTGRVMDTHPGYASRWLAPMTGFGYIAEHIGEIQGWEWALDGAEPLGGNWFRVRVGDGQQRKVRTRIQAVEETRMPPGNPIWPPGPAWLNTTGVAPAAVTVKVTKQGGCSTTGSGDDAGAGAAAGGLLALAGLLATRRRAPTRRW